MLSLKCRGRLYGSEEDLGGSNSQIGRQRQLLSGMGCKRRGKNAGGEEGIPWNGLAAEVDFLLGGTT